MIIDANLAELSTTEKDGKNRKKQVLDFDVCFIRIDGTPCSQQRHRVTNIKGKPRMYDPSSKNKEKFKKALLSRSRKRVSGRVGLSITFYMPRPKHHYRTGKYKNILKKTSPWLHTIKPDIDNLLKFVMDAGQNVIWADDCQIFQVETRKCYSKYPRTEIEYWEMPEELDTQEGMPDGF